MPTIDLPTIGLLVVLAVLVFLMFRNSRKRKAQLEEMRTQIVPGAEVMTNFGLYGTLRSIDEVTKVAELEISPGSVVRVHSQTIAKVVTDDPAAEGEPRSVEEAMAIANREAEQREAARTGALPEDGAAHEIPGDETPIDEAASTPEPQYGELKKPARRTTKKVAE